MLRYVAIVCLAGMGIIPAPPLPAGDAGGDDFFENRVRPVLSGVCLRCHGPQKQSGGLRVDTRDALAKGGDSGPAIDSTDFEQSLILDAIRRVEGVSAMPPDKPLAPQQVADLAAWVKAGAPWPKQKARISALTHWAFQSVCDRGPPAVRDERWVRTSVDRFILARLESLGQKPAPEADRPTLLRRMTFALTGLPPTFDEVVAFERDKSPQAIETALDRLLASPQYGERWGRHWLDVVRYADTAGETADIPIPAAWHYRNYVIDAFNADRSYREFLREQIAGDILAEKGPRARYAERVTATGYLAISRRFGFDSENYNHLTIQDTIDTLGQSVLGLSLGCARCHDHKFDPVSMGDYYAIYGIFDSSRYAFPGSEQKQQTRALVPLVPSGESRVRWREFDAQVKALVGALEKQKRPIPTAVLRSLHNVDGDFELQAPAAGGSNGVLVPPWLYEGTIAIASEAQSPFTNLYSRGKVGVSVPEGPRSYRIAQAIYPERTPETCRLLHVNLDFRIAAPRTGTTRQHRFWIGEGPNSPAVELLISTSAVEMRSGKKSEQLASVQANEWHNVQLVLDLESQTCSGSIQTTQHATAFSGKTFSSDRPRRIDLVAFDSVRPAETQHEAAISTPAIEFDNLGIEEQPIPSISAPATEANSDRAAPEANAGALEQRLVALLANGPFAMTYGMAEGTPHDVRIQLRGEPDHPGASVRRGFIKALGGGPLANDVKGSGRLELSNWLTRTDNPLVARVMVNRIWQHHFGTGLVKTPNDFGARGMPPSHPELLDHLATRFIQSGWSVKAMHRLIMLSATFQQTSLSNKRQGESSGRTSGGEVFAPFARRRLSAEEIRDAILAISGELDRTPAHAHPFPSPIGWGFTQHAPFAAVYDHDKRSIYLMTQRIKRHPFLALFDGADPNATTAVRMTTTVPTQALYFLNDPFVYAKAEKYAARLEAALPTPGQRIERAWGDVLGRLPTDREREESLKFIEEYRNGLAELKQDRAEIGAFAALFRTLIGSNEFIYLD